MCLNYRMRKNRHTMKKRLTAKKRQNGGEIPVNQPKQHRPLFPKPSNCNTKVQNLEKKMKALPRSKPPGIGIDIQGRDRDKYKIRITGARNKEQLNDIIDLMRVLIFLYSEIYLYGQPLVLI